VVAIVLVGLSVVVGRVATDDERSRSEARAVSYAREVIQPSIAQASLRDPLDSVLLDPLQAVRVWSPDGTPLFSSIRDDPIGGEALNDGLLVQAAATGSPVTVTARSSAEDQSRTSELITYIAVDSGNDDRAVVEVVQDFDATLGAVQSRWFRLQVFGAALVLAFLALTILSFRKPIARIGAGVGFVAEAVPPGYAVIEEERLRSVNDVYERAQERVLRLKESLRASEDARRATEGRLQRMLSKFEPSKPVTATTHPEELLAEEAVPSTVEEQRPNPDPVVIPEPESADPVEVLNASTMPHIVGLQDEDEDDAELARDLLLRLIETEVPMADRGVDPGEVRARLARTAARKKPGGGERRIVEDEPVREMPPWARNR
jgi:hypothetical protein